MLVPIVFIVAFLTALTGALLESSLLAAKAADSAAVARNSDVAIADGVADFTHGLAAFVALHGGAGPWPQHTSYSAQKSGCAAADAQQCPFRYIIGGTITNASDANAAAPGTPDAAQNLQAAAIDEQRVSAIVSVTFVTPGSSAVGTRTRFLTYRVFDTAPYAVISGSRDMTTENGTQSAAQGDSGGAAAALDSQAAGFDDTRIHVRLTCDTVIKGVIPFANDQQAAGNDGLPWGNAAQAAYETPCTSSDAPADAFRDERWTNGDANTSGWTQ